MIEDANLVKPSLLEKSVTARFDLVQETRRHLAFDSHGATPGEKEGLLHLHQDICPDQR